MAFNVSAQDPKVIEAVGSMTELRHGTVALSGGTATVTIPGVSSVVGAIAHSQTSNAARVSATDANTLTISGTGTDIVFWIAVCKGGV
jgi:hypothetical protein